MQSLNGLAIKILKGSFPPITPMYSKPLRDMIGQMLNQNPKKRPTIYDILNKPILKKKVIQYISEIVSGQCEVSEWGEVINLNVILMDLIKHQENYFDSLREQANKLGIIVQIREIVEAQEQKKGQQIKASPKKNYKVVSHPAQVNEIKKIQQIQKMTKEKQKIALEKQRLESEIVELQQQQQSRGRMKERLQTEDNKPILEKRENNFQISNEFDPQQQQQEEETLAKKEKKIKRIRSLDKKFERKGREKKEERSISIERMGVDESQKFEFANQKERVIYEKQQKIKQEEEQYQNVYRELIQQTQKDRLIAKEKLTAQYRPSQEHAEAPKQATVYKPPNVYSVGALIDTKEKNKQKKICKLQEDYAMDEEDEQNEEEEVIFEVDEDADIEMDLENQIEYKNTQLMEKTMQMNMIEKEIETLQKSSESIQERDLDEGEEQQQQDQQQEEIEMKQTEFKMNYFLSERASISDNDDLKFTEKSNKIADIQIQPQIAPPRKEPCSNPTYIQLSEKITQFKQQCVSILGAQVYEQAYKIVFEKTDIMEGQLMRKQLIQIMGEDNIGFWHLINQIIFFEGMLKDFEK